MAKKIKSYKESVMMKIIPWSFVGSIASIISDTASDVNMQRHSYNLQPDLLALTFQSSALALTLNP